MQMWPDVIWKLEMNTPIFTSNHPQIYQEFSEVYYHTFTQTTTFKVEHTLDHPSNTVYPVYPYISCVPMFTLVVLYTLSSSLNVQDNYNTMANRIYGGIQGYTGYTVLLG